MIKEGAKEATCNSNSWNNSPGQKFVQSHNGKFFKVILKLKPFT